MDEDTAGKGDLEAALQVSLPAFEGPLDLLLYLIKKNRLNIYDIPIARITEDYLRSLEQMRSLNLEAAGQVPGDGGDLGLYQVAPAYPSV